MEKINFKWGLFLGGLMLLNFIFLAINLFIIASGKGGIGNIFSGCIHVYCAFLYSMWCSEALDQE